MPVEGRRDLYLGIIWNAWIRGNRDGIVRKFMEVAFKLYTLRYKVNSPKLCVFADNSNSIFLLLTLISRWWGGKLNGAILSELGLLQTG